MAKVLKKALVRSSSWVSWYMESNADKKSALALYKMAVEIVEATLIKVNSRNKANQALYLKTLRKVKRGIQVDAIQDIPGEYSSQIATDLHRLLVEIENAIDAKKDENWRFLAEISSDAIRRCDALFGRSKYPSLKKAIELFDTFPVSV